MIHLATSTWRHRRDLLEPASEPEARPAAATSGLTGRRYPWLSNGGTVRALGLEPSLVRGKGPVPYQSGVARIGGPGRNRTPCVGRRLVYSQLRPMARPTRVRGQLALAPTMPLQLSRC